MSEIASINATCCVTGHRGLTGEIAEKVKLELRDEISIAVLSGFTRYISGFAESVDLYFAEIVAELKEKSPNIKLEAAIPYPKRLEAHDEQFQQLKAKCDFITIHSEAYSKACFAKRNEYMIQQSQRVIAVYDGRATGGTFMTLNLARKYGRDIRIIRI